MHLRTCIGLRSNEAIATTPSDPRCLVISLSCCRSSPTTDASQEPFCRCTPPSGDASQEVRRREFCGSLVLSGATTLSNPRCLIISLSCCRSSLTRGDASQEPFCRPTPPSGDAIQEVRRREFRGSLILSGVFRCFLRGALQLDGAAGALSCRWTQESKLCKT